MKNKQSILPLSNKESVFEVLRSTMKLQGTNSYDKAFQRLSNELRKEPNGKTVIMESRITSMALKNKLLAVGLQEGGIQIFRMTDSDSPLVGLVVPNDKFILTDLESSFDIEVGSQAKKINILIFNEDATLLVASCYDTNLYIFKIDGDKVTLHDEVEDLGKNMDELNFMNNNKFLICNSERGGIVLFKIDDNLKFEKMPKIDLPIKKSSKIIAVDRTKTRLLIFIENEIQLYELKEGSGEGDDAKPPFLNKLCSLELKDVRLIRYVCFHKKQGLVICATLKRRFFIFDFSEDKLSIKFQSPSNTDSAGTDQPISFVAMGYNEDQNLFAFSTEDNKICLYRLKEIKKGFKTMYNFQMFYELSMNSMPTISINFAEENKLMILGSLDRSLKFFKIEKFPIFENQFIETIKDLEVTNFAMNNNSTKMCTIDDKYNVKILKLENEKFVLEHSMTFKPFEDENLGCECTGAAINSLLEYLVISFENKMIQLYSIEGGSIKLKEKIEGHDKVCYLPMFSPDSKWIVAPSIDFSINLWKLNKSGPSKLIQTLDSHSSAVSYLNFSLDSTMLVTGGGTIKLWKLDKDQDDEKFYLSQTIPGHDENTITNINLSPDNRFMVSVAEDLVVKLYKLEAGIIKLYKQFENKDEDKGVNRYAGNQAALFSPNGGLLAVMSNDKRLVIWEIDRMGEIKKIQESVLEESGTRFSVFSPDFSSLIIHNNEECINILKLCPKNEVSDILYLFFIEKLVSSNFGKEIFDKFFDHYSKIWADCKTLYHRVQFEISINPISIAQMSKSRSVLKIALEKFGYRSYVYNRDEYRHYDPFLTALKIDNETMLKV